MPSDNRLPVGPHPGGSFADARLLTPLLNHTPAPAHNSTIVFPPPSPPRRETGLLMNLAWVSTRNSVEPELPRFSAQAATVGPFYAPITSIPSKHLCRSPETALRTIGLYRNQKFVALRGRQIALLRRSGARTGYALRRHTCLRKGRRPRQGEGASYPVARVSLGSP